VCGAARARSTTFESTGSHGRGSGHEACRDRPPEEAGAAHGHAALLDIANEPARHHDRLTEPIVPLAAPVLYLAHRQRDRAGVRPNHVSGDLLDPGPDPGAERIAPVVGQCDLHPHARHRHGGRERAIRIATHQEQKCEAGGGPPSRQLPSGTDEV
jgi:hypothetical protein